MTSSYKVIYEAFQCVCWPPSLRLFSILHIICIEDNCLPGNSQVMQLCWWSPLFDDSPPLASSVVCPSSLVLLFPLEAQTPCIRTRAQLLLAVTLFLFFPFSPRRTRRKGGKEWGSSRKALGDWQQCPLMMHYLPAEAGSFGAAVDSTPRCLSGLWSWLCRHSSIPCYSRPSALQPCQRVAWLRCGCQLCLSPQGSC